MKMSLKNLMLIMLGVLLGGNADAGLISDEGSLDQYAEQSQGNYQPMNLNYAGFNNLGMIQEAWQDPLQNLGEGQSKPAYSRYYWSPDLVLPMRLREGMITLVNFPEWELIEEVFVGDPGSFAGSVVEPNSVMLYPIAGKNGVDTNIVVFGRSGNKYVFYARSEAYNTERLTNSVVDIEVSKKGGSAGSISGGYSGAGANAAAFNGSDKTVASSYTKRFQKEDWLKSIPMDPEKFRFDIEIYVPNPDDVIIAPERVWHDDIFTYIDLGEKALNMIQRPIVTMIIERSETPVGFRTKGPNNRLIIVEGVGDMVMRSGKRMVCLKLRRSDDEGTQYVTYADDSDSWDVAPAIPGGAKAASNNSGGFIKDNKGGMYVPNAAKSSFSEENDCGNMPCSSMSRLNSNGMNLQNPYPNYKYGSAFKNQSGDHLSVELGTDANVGNLETLWKDLSSQYPKVLGDYEPFYSVDTPADGQGKDLFHLRVGPIKSMETGDSICNKLGRNGVFCSVVRTQ